VLAAAPTSAPSLGRRLEAAPTTVTSATAAAVAGAGSQPSRPQRLRDLGAQSDKLPKSMASPVGDLDEMEAGQSAIGQLTSCAGGHHNMPPPPAS